VFIVFFVFFVFIPSPVFPSANLGQFVISGQPRRLSPHQAV
jgi:hypothetical protein